MYEVSNKFEILAEYKAANRELNELENREHGYVTSTTQTIKNNVNERAHNLSRKCDQLEMILEAIAASED